MALLGAELSGSVVLATQHLVVDDALMHVAGEELRSFASDDSVDHSGVAATFLTTPARGGERQFLCAVSDGEEARGAGKYVEQEVGGEPEGVHVDPVVVDHLGQLVDLLGTGELGLVDHEDVVALLDEPFDMRGQVLAGRDGVGVSLDADARSDHALGAAIPEGP